MGMMDLYEFRALTLRMADNFDELAGWLVRTAADLSDANREIYETMAVTYKESANGIRQTLNTLETMQ